MENMDKGLTVPKCLVLIHKLAEKYPKGYKNFLPKLSAKAQKFGISMKKGFIGHP
jgi:hypothetical protein